MARLVGSCVLQSLHTTVLPLGSTLLFPLEVQILTSKMQELAEFGIAGTARATPPQPPTHPCCVAECHQSHHRTTRPPPRRLLCCRREVGGD